MSEAVYENRYVAFIDILGFARRVDQSERDPKIALLLHDVLHGFRLAKEANTAGVDALGTQVSFSDSIFCSSSTLVNILAVALGAQRSLLQVGLLCRGAIAFGLVHHKAPVVFGPALVRAYRVETTAAVYPRIVVDDLVVRGMPEAMRTDLLEQDSDGLWFMPAFRSWPLMAQLEGAQSLGRILAAGFTEAAPTRDAGVLAKWHWMIRRFNAALALAHPGEDQIGVTP